MVPLVFFLKQAKMNKKITLYGQGEVKRTFTHIFDICDVFLKIAEKSDATNSIYNIGGETFSLQEIAKKIAKIYNSKIECIEWPNEALKIESGDTIFDSKKIDDYLMKKKYLKLTFD